MTPDTAMDSHPDTAAARRFARVVPLALVTYGLAYIDRVNYGYAESRLRAALGITPFLSALIASLFFLGYFAFQIPGAAIAARRGVRWLIFWTLLAWGVLSSLTGCVHSVRWLIVVRLLLGAVEGVVVPAMLVHLTRWFIKPERSRANAVMLIAMPLTMATASVLSGWLIYYFDRHPHFGLAGWQMMFVLEGAPSIIWALVWIALAREKPQDAGWLTAAAARELQEQIDDEQRQIPQMRNYRAALSDWRLWCFVTYYLMFNVAAYGLMMWLPQIVEEGARRGVATAGLLTSIPYVLAVFAILAVSWASDRTRQRKPFVWGSMAAGCAAYLLAFAAGREHFGLAFAGLIVVGSAIYTSNAPMWAWMTELISRNVLAESMALVNSAGALGGFLGTMAVGWLKNLTGSTASAYLLQAGCFAVAMMATLLVPRTD